jgi:hypothetical protein
MRQFSTKWFVLMLYYQYTGQQDMAEYAKVMATTYNDYHLNSF